MEVVGRIPEKMALRGYSASDKPEFIAVCGRRRVGKTYLVREFFGGDFAFYLTGLANANLKEQIAAFNEAAHDYYPSNIHKPEPVSNWMEAFGLLREIVEKSHAIGKKMIFIDELPWLDTPRSGFLTALEHFWNSWASSRPDVMLIVCGSTTSWFIKNLLENKGGLHHRLTGMIMLEPFTLGECEQYCESLGLFLNRQLLLGVYMALGGTPYYYSLFEKSLTLPQNIDALFFNETGMLKGEFDELYGSLFRNPKMHKQIVKAMSKKNTPMTRDEIIAEIKSGSGGTFSNTLEELAQCGFIEKYTDFKKTKNGSWYLLADAISLFWLRFSGGRGKKEENFWVNHFSDTKARAWRRFAYEQICWHHIRQVKKTLGIAGVSTTISTWRDKDAKSTEHVNLIIDRKDDVINICEIEFSESALAIDKKRFDELTGKVQAFRAETGTKKAVHLTMITPYGLKHNAFLGIADEEVTLNDLF
ncbi:MAG: AAA family ATPase [Clostridiales Family XIII bacterium]|jgi:AAA+ ATPase superfamily predicted ATPase|nr:AAA family ATPase [Clostridiales Family XIII bacterium]